MESPLVATSRPAGGYPLRRLKGAFPFRLGTTSFVLHDDITPNIIFLAPLVDEIELLCFEGGAPEHRPSRRNIARWADLGVAYSIRYNIHLPIDLSLGDGDPDNRRHSCRLMLDIYERTRILDPTAYILHMDRPGPGDDFSTCRDRWRRSLDILLEGGVEAGLLCLENLDYPLAWTDRLAREYGFSLCLDIGHLLIQQEDLSASFRRYGRRTTMVHLHGVADGRDHRSVAAIPPEGWSAVRSFLASYRHGVSIEVFSVADLSTSLQRMEELRPWPT